MSVRILSIAGSDSGGGAGIQADIKTIQALGGFAMTAITAITAQNTQGVQAVHPIPPDMVARQIRACIEDIGVDAIKIGMLHHRAIIAAVAEALQDVAVPIILDPVMVATSGDTLLDKEAVSALKRFMSQVSILTPNLPEAALLTGNLITTTKAMEAAAKSLQQASQGAAIVLKGGHLQGETVHDLLYQQGEAFWFESARIHSPHTHGTGCTLASAIATIGAQGNPLFVAVQQARDYVRQAIETAPGLGQGNGPLNHQIS